MRVARLPLHVGGLLLGLLTMAPGCLVPDRQMSERMVSDARKREQFQRLKEQFVKDQEVGGLALGRGGGLEGSASLAGCLWGVLQRRRVARQEELDEDFSYARELRDRERRLRALEEQLERKARWVAGGAMAMGLAFLGVTAGFTFVVAGCLLSVSGTFQASVRREQWRPELGLLAVALCGLGSRLGPRCARILSLSLCFL